MATSSSDDSITAPRDFQLSSSLDSGSRLSPNRQKCPLCTKFRKTFYCKDCVLSGNFYSSSSHFSERYGDKQCRLFELKAGQKTVEEKCSELLSKKQKVDILQSKIRQYKDRINILTKALEEKTEHQTANTEKLKELSAQNNKLSNDLPIYEKKVDRLESFISSKWEDVAKSKEKLAARRSKVKQLANLRIKQLIQYIFPIAIVQPKSEVESTELDMVSALAEATRTTFIRDRWIYTDNSGELQHSIVAPSLPGSGNYSAYNIWVAQNKDAVPGSSSNIAVEHNPAYSISAALTYTAQLVNIIAFYLDIRLPYKMVYSDFCSNDITEQQFARRVARLNANVLQICFLQNTALESLQPSKTLHNVLQLLDEDITDLGRQGPMEVDVRVARNLEEQLSNDLQTSEDSDSEEGDALPYEWEAVPHVQCPEAPAGPVSPPSAQMTTTQQASSMAGGLVTSAAASIASIWRGWTGR